MVKSSPDIKLATSALRIYLVYTLHQTQDFIRTGHQSITLSTQFFSNIENKGVRSSNNWTIIKKAARKVVDYILKCQEALESSQCLSPVFCLLSAIEASQDSLHETKRCFSQDDYKRRIDLSAKHACRAKYLTCAYEAIHRHGDHDLSQLWLAAARKLNEQILLKLDTEHQVNDRASKKLLQMADLKSTIIVQQGQVWSETRIHLLTCAVRQYHRAAAKTALNQGNTHEDYAEVYLKASATRARIECAISLTETAILERVALCLQLAIDLIELDEKNGNIMLHDADIHNYMSAAEILCKNSHRAIEFANTIEAQKAQLASTIAAEGKERDAKMRRVWQILRAEQAEAIAKSEACMHGVLASDGDIIAGLALMASIDTAVKKVADTVNEIFACHKRISLYTHKAAQALQTIQLSQLANQCWTQAAAHMETEAQVCTDFLLNGTYHEASLDQHPEWKLECESTKRYVKIAESYVERAVEYLNKARGAKAAVKNGRDPREAQMWRKAAECLSDKAEQLLQKPVNDELSSVTEGFDTVVDLEEMIRVYSQTAEYYNLSFQHRTLPEARTRQNGTRVADLYERLAVLKSNVFDVEAHDAVTNAAIDFYVRAINVLNQSSVLEAEKLVWWEKSIEYAVHACNPSFDSVYAARHWLCAFLLAKDVAKGYVDSASMAVVLAKGLIALHACAAESTQERARIVYEAYIAEVSALVSTIPGYFPPDRQYKLALVAHMIQSESTSVDSEVFNLPSEVRNIVNLAIGHGFRTSLLDEHVHALLLKAQCLYCLETLTDVEQDRECWEEAYSATIDLCQAYTLRSIERPTGQNSPRLLSYLAYRKAVARRLVAKAEAVVPEPVPQADLLAPSTADTDTEWPESTTTNTIDNRRALVAVEQYTWAAEQAELHAATEAYGRQCKLKSLSNELKHAVDYAQRLSVNPTDEESRINFNHYEVGVLGTIEQLRKDHVSVMAYSVIWGQ